MCRAVLGERLLGLHRVFAWVMGCLNVLRKVLCLLPKTPKPGFDCVRVFEVLNARGAFQALGCIGFLPLC